VERKLLAVFVFACMLGGCATTDSSTAADQPREEGAYVTGSRLPQRSAGPAPVSQQSKESWENDTRGRQVNPQGR
jgi:hypothetical protein